MLTQKGQRIFTRARHQLLKLSPWQSRKPSCSNQSCTGQSYFSKPFDTWVRSAFVDGESAFLPSQPDTGGSDIIIYGESCWQRNANIDLEAQSHTKLLSSLSHEAQWCLYGNFTRPLKQDIRHRNVIFTAALFHNYPHRWWMFDDGKHTNRIWRTCTNWMLSPLSRTGGRISWGACMHCVSLKEPQALWAVCVKCNHNTGKKHLITHLWTEDYISVSLARQCRGHE